MEARSCSTDCTGEVAPDRRAAGVSGWRPKLRKKGECPVDALLRVVDAGTPPA